MEVAIDCSCGTRYKFDVEPVNGQMPATVQCPECGVDGTEAANAYIQQQTAASDPSTASSPLTIQRREPDLAHEPPSHTAAAPVSRGVPSAPPPPKKKKKKRGYGEPNILLGTVGAVAAGFIAMIVWFAIIKATNIEFGFIAWAVGGVVGVGCRILGGGYSQTLGFIAAACALVAIVGGEYLATKSAYDEIVDGILEEAYDARMGYAQRAQKLGTDQEIRKFIVLEWSDEDEQYTMDSVTQEDIDNFRDVELPELKEFINGNPSREEFEEKLQATFNSGSMKAMVLKESISLWTLLWLFLGVGSAYRLGIGETE